MVLGYLGCAGMQDPNIWRDLNPKFILMIYRYHVVVGNGTDLLVRTWPAVLAALKYIQAFDLNGDGIPEHHPEGSDQTYDHWGMRGDMSTYCGGLYLAALQATASIARILNHTQYAEELDRLLSSSFEVFEQTLWNGVYYRFDASVRPANSDTIMADALAGLWYLDAVGEKSLYEAARVRSALLTAYYFNVELYGRGTSLGAVNGMFPSGAVDETNLQSQEVWTGTSYALAAHMLHRKLTKEAWSVAFGIYNITYNNGLAFRTPEAWDKNLRYRASMYHRPLCIWAMERALHSSTVRVV
mmetsp:Transcript_5699/g.10872  ORF Transcript_5699/g.10872 Transcript_5699/m.10872 type:complete len:299 (+) Transcript_5699:660-1556(+)